MQGIQVLVLGFLVLSSGFNAIPVNNGYDALQSNEFLSSFAAEQLANDLSSWENSPQSIGDDTSLSKSQNYSLKSLIENEYDSQIVSRVVTETESASSRVDVGLSKGNYSQPTVKRRGRPKGSTNSSNKMISAEMAAKRKRATNGINFEKDTDSGIHEALRNARRHQCIDFPFTTSSKLFILHPTVTASMSNPEALFKLGVRYYKGEGAQQSDVEAFKFLKMSAELAHLAAQNNVGIFYEQGKVVEKDFRLAFTWYFRAAYQDQASAQFNLGRCYVFGIHVRKNEKTALSWFEKAANQGIQAAINVVQKISSEYGIDAITNDILLTTPLFNDDDGSLTNDQTPANQYLTDDSVLCKIDGGYSNNCENTEQREHSFDPLSENVSDNDNGTFDLSCQSNSCLGSPCDDLTANSFVSEERITTEPTSNYVMPHQKFYDTEDLNPAQNVFHYSTSPESIQNPLNYNEAASQQQIMGNLNDIMFDISLLPSFDQAPLQHYTQYDTPVMISCPSQEMNVPTHQMFNDVIIAKQRRIPLTIGEIDQTLVFRNQVIANKIPNIQDISIYAWDDSFHFQVNCAFVVIEELVIQCIDNRLTVLLKRMDVNNQGKTVLFSSASIWNKMLLQISWNSGICNDTQCLWPITS